MLVLELKAPFAACRPMTAGWYRPTAPMLTPSAAYGLLLNVGCIETRLREEEPGHTGRVPTSLTRDGLPVVRLAIGLPESVPPPRIQTVYQQLHNYLQDNSKMDDPLNPGQKIRRQAEGDRRAKGNKYNITPVRREFLAGLHVVLCMDGNEDLESRVRRGLAGAFNAERYGLPFVGDNTFLIDQLSERKLGEIPACRWYETVGHEADADRVPETARLTTWIDRANMTGTRSELFTPSTNATTEVPREAWQWIPPNKPQPT